MKIRKRITIDSNKQAPYEALNKPRRAGCFLLFPVSGVNSFTILKTVFKQKRLKTFAFFAVK
jgi:hypothetical protein